MADHTAGPQLLGYLYQVDQALLQVLRRGQSDPKVSIAIELLDDITFEVDGTPTELLQTKHHLGRQGSLSDRSPDLWQTITAWIDAFTGSSLDLASTSFTLITTGGAPAGSIASRLCDGEERDVESALKAMRDVATESDPPRADRAAFASLNATQQESLAKAMHVLPGSSSAVNLHAQLEQQLFFAVEAEYRSPLIDRLIATWHRLVVRSLAARPRRRISFTEIAAEIDHLRDGFRSDNLPIDILTTDVGLTMLSADDRRFVRQLQLIAIEERGIELAIRDYKRAYLQRRRWMADGLVDQVELERYEDRLIDEWEHLRTARPLADDANDDVRLHHGRSVYQATSAVSEPIRPRVVDRFVTRGTYQMLADDLKVGWHPDFVDRLRQLTVEE